MSRAALSVVEPDTPAPEPLSAALRDLGQATEALAGYLDAPEDPEDTRQLALRAVQGATALLEEHQDLATNLAINALVDQVHSATVDILGGTGMDREAALQALREAARRTSEPG